VDFLERERLPAAVLQRRPCGCSLTSTNRACSGLLRTQSPCPSRVGVALAWRNSALQLTQLCFKRRKSRPRTRPTQRQPRRSTAR
jgi:hypothetical protein